MRNSQGSTSRGSSLECTQGMQIRLVASFRYSPEARPQKGVFKCFAYEFTSHPRYEHVNISALTQVSFSWFFNPMKQTKITKPKQVIDKKTSGSSSHMFSLYFTILIKGHRISCCK